MRLLLEAVVAGEADDEMIRGATVRRMIEEVRSEMPERPEVVTSKQAAEPEEDPAMDKSELLRHLWRREAVRNIHHPAPPWQNGSSGATPRDGRA